jgi:hypothetical protein
VSRLPRERMADITADRLRFEKMSAMIGPIPTYRSLIWKANS